MKLHKALYFSDMLTYVRDGRPLTGAAYRKRPFGPTCEPLRRALLELEREGRLEVRRELYFGFEKKVFVPIGATVDTALSADDRALVDAVVDFVCMGNTAKSISEISHTPAWDLVEFGEIMPYVSAFHIFPMEVSEDALAWADQQGESLETARSVGNPLELEEYAAFRDRVLQAL